MFANLKVELKGLFANLKVGLKELFANLKVELKWLFANLKLHIISNFEIRNTNLVYHIKIFLIVWSMNSWGFVNSCKMEIGTLL